MIPKPRIYLSVPSDQHLSPERLKLKLAIIGAIETEGFEVQEFFARGVPANMSWDFEKANAIMARCEGVVVLAFVRWAFKDGQQATILMPSEWNHFEGALATTRDLPLMVIAERGVPNRGIAYTGGGIAITFMPAGAKPNWLKSQEFKTRFSGWVSEVKKRPRAFLGYCSKAKSTADALTLYLEKMLGVAVRNYAMDFRPGGTILEEIQEACRDCACGIFLFSKDDQLEGLDSDSAAPRDNVVFEAGYFMHAKGKERVLVILEKGAKIPADLGGNIYVSLKDRNDISTIQTQVQAFLEQRL